MWDWKRRYEYRRLTSYLAVPALAIWGIYVAVKLEFRFNSVHVEGPLAILIGVGLFALAVLLFLLFVWRDSRHFESEVRDS